MTGGNNLPYMAKSAAVTWFVMMPTCQNMIIVLVSHVAADRGHIPRTIHAVHVDVNVPYMDFKPIAPSLACSAMAEPDGFTKVDPPGSFKSGAIFDYRHCIIIMLCMDFRVTQCTVHVHVCAASWKLVLPQVIMKMSWFKLNAHEVVTVYFLRYHYCPLNVRCIPPFVVKIIVNIVQLFVSFDTSCLCALLADNQEIVHATMCM